MAKQLNVNLAFTADTGQAKAQIQELQATLNQIAYAGSTTTGISKQTESIKQASTAAKELQIHLNNAFDATTGKFDLSRLDKSLKASGSNIGDLSTKLLSAGETGQQAFAQLAQSISQANQPMLRINKHLSEMWTVMKNTMRWQLSSSMIHGFMGTVQQAYGYVQDLNESLNNIRIVTGYSAEQMADFAKEANKAAKALSTTTTEYTDASLIYYQQGLSDAEVKERTDVTIKMANVAGQSAQTVSDQMTAVWNNFDDGSKSLEYYADVMTALGAATASSTAEISTGLEKFAAIAETVGLSYEYSTAALATITATTRQSADVVGNALKTLFARIQGLSLGETLEDGVDLNKYSKALDTVGVKVLDTNGQMREMDDILNDLAAKWDTIGKAEQTALAQTVAGVRQYTQLIALMDNWDFMKENLNIAYNAEGTLQEQADIYAQSWEAATDRVKAAAEGIYDSLLNDEFFIDINNGFANLLGGLESFIDGIGGAKGIILAFSSIILSNFSHKIPQAIDDLRYNFVYLTKGAQEAYKNIQEDMNSAYSQMDDSQKYSSFGANVKYSNELTAARNKLAMVTDSMSNSERQLEETELNLIETQKQELITLKQKNEELYQSISLTMKSEAEDTMDVLGAQAISSVENTDIAKYLSNQQESINNMAHEIGIKAMKAMADGVRQGQIDVSQSLQVIIDGFQKIEINEGNLEASKEQIKALINILPEGVQNALKLSNALNDLDGANIEKTRGIVQQLKTQLKEGKISAVDLREVLRSLYGPEWQKILKDVKVLKSGLGEAKDKAKSLSEAFKGFNPTHIITPIERISQAAAGLGQVAMSINAISSLFKTLSNPDLSGWEKLTASMMSISMLVPGIIGAFKSFNIVLDGAQSKSLAYWFSQKVQYIELDKATLQRIRDEVTLDTIGQARSKEEIAAMMAEKAVQEGLVNVSEEQIVAEEILKAEKEGGIGVSIKRTLAQKLETIGIWDNTASLGANTLALIKNTAAAIANFTASHPLLMITLALAAATIAFVKAIKDYKTPAEQATENAKKQKERYKELSQAAKEAADSVTNLKNAWDELSNSKDNLSRLTEGTLEWKQALLETNSQVLALIETYPELAQYMTRGANGVLSISEEGYQVAVNKQIEEADKAMNAALIQSVSATKAQSLSDEYETKSVAREKLIENTINLPNGLLGKSNATAEYNLDDLYKAYEQGIITIEDGIIKNLDNVENIDLLARQTIKANSDAFIDYLTTRKESSLQSDIKNSNAIAVAAQSVNADNLKDTKYGNAYIEKYLNDESSSGYQARFAEEQKKVFTSQGTEKAKQQYIDLYGGTELKYDRKSKTYDLLDEKGEAIEGYKGITINDIRNAVAESNALIMSDNYVQESKDIAEIGEYFKQAGLRDEQITSLLEDYAQNKRFDFSNLTPEQLNQIKGINFSDYQNMVNTGITNYSVDKRINNMEQTKKWMENKDSLEALDRQDALLEGEIDSDTFNDYAKSIQEKNKLDEDQIELAEEIAEWNIKNSNVMKKYSKIIEDNKDALKENNDVVNKEAEGSIDYWKAIEELEEATEEWLDIDIDSSFIQNNLDLITEAANGSTEAIETLGKEAAKDILLQAETNFPELGPQFDNLRSWIDDMPSDIKIGAELEDSAFIDGLNEMLAAGTITADQANQILSGIGYDPVIEYETAEATTTGSSGGTLLQRIFGALESGDWSSVWQSKGTVQVPVIRTAGNKGSSGKVSTYKGHNTSSTPNKTSSGGGGGGSSKKPQKKNDSEKDRYHTLRNQLEDISKEYDAISEAVDRAFGEDKLKLMDDQIAKADEFIDKQEEIVEAVKADLPIDNNNMIAYYNELFGKSGTSLEFDIRGNISNYDDVWEAMRDTYNSMADKYTEDDIEWQVFEEKYDKFEKYLEQYEETYDVLKDEEEKLQNLINQRTDLLLEQVQYNLELKLNLNEDGLNLLDYQLSKIDDDAFKAAESIALIGQQADLLYQQMMIDRDGLKDILSLTINSESTVNQILDGEYVDLSGYNFNEDQISALKEYRDNLLNANEQMAELRDTVQEKLSDAFDAWNEKVQKGIDGIEHYGSIIEHYSNIIDTVGQEFLGVTDDLMASLTQSSVDNAITNLIAVKNQYEAIESARKNAEDKLNNAKTEEDIKFWQEQLDTLTEESRDAADNVLSAWEEALSSAVSAFEASVERAMNVFNMSVYADGGLEGLGEDFERQQKLSDMYLQDYQQIYELSKLNRDINNSIDDTKSLAGKQKLKKLLEEINDIQESGLEMSEYDLEYLQAEYELRLAEIALEEAQNAKDTVRLQKDNEGNWSYVYTSSTDAVDEAQQKYEDALYAMQDLSSNYINEMSDQLIQTSQEMAEELANLRIEDFASIDDYYTKVKEIQDSYAEEMALQEGELNKAIANNKELYDTDWTNYHNATGYKISDTEEFVTRFSDSMLGLLMGSEEESSVFADFINNAAVTLTESLKQNALSYEENVKNAMDAAGTSLEDFADQTETYLGKVQEATATAAGQVNTATGEMKQGFADLSDEIAGWQNTYGAAADSVIAKNEELINSMNKLLTALSIDEDDIMVDYTIKTVPAFSEEDIPEEASAATGGYTGDWTDNSGRLALLHKKELILDDNDTSNFVTALGLTKDILQVIDLNAKQASLAYGPMVASTLRDETTQMLEQSVHITAEFPNVSDQNEIKEAFNSLINTASQFANRK